jgi:hypothetical protein
MHIRSADTGPFDLSKNSSSQQTYHQKSEARHVYLLVYIQRAEGTMSIVHRRVSFHGFSVLFMGRETFTPPHESEEWHA